MKTIETKKKRIWNRPIVQDEHAGMEVTSYASAGLGTT
jgi:coenzyme PQQ precursor peptide PqqA